MDDQNKIEFQIVTDEGKVIRSDHLYIKGGDVLICTVPSNIRPDVLAEIGKAATNAIKNPNGGVMILPDIVKMKVLRKKVIHEKKTEVKKT